MSRASFVLLITPIALLGGCHAKVDSATFATRPPRPEHAEVRIFRDRPACAYEEIGVVLWRRGDARDSLEKGSAGMKARAREMGGDAIVDFRFEEPTTLVTTTTHADTARSESITRIARGHAASGTVVRFLEDGCP